MKLIKWGRTSNGQTWGISEDDYGFWLTTGRTVFHVEDQIREGCATDCYPNYERAYKAANEL